MPIDKQALKKYANKDQKKDDDGPEAKGLKPRPPFGAKTPPARKGKEDDKADDGNGDDGDPEYSAEMEKFFESFPEKFQPELKTKLDAVAKAMKEDGGADDALNALFDFLAGHEVKEKKDDETGHEDDKGDDGDDEEDDDRN